MIIYYNTMITFHHKQKADNNSFGLTHDVVKSSFILALPQ